MSEHPLALWRQENQKTQLQCAKAWKVSKGYLAQIETFQCLPGTRMMLIIQKHTGISPDQLLNVPLRKPTRKKRPASHVRKTKKVSRTAPRNARRKSPR